MRNGVITVDKPSDMLEAVVRTARANAPVQPDDYTDEEGFLCCGKCRTRKEAEIEIKDKNIKIKVPVSCRCRAEQIRRDEEEQKKKDDMRLIRQLKEQSLMDERLKKATFSSFVTTEHNARNLKLCRRYAEHFDEMLAKDQGLLMYGPVGTGKTFAAACIANHLLDLSIPVVMTSFVKLLDTMQSFKDEDSALISKLNRAKLLIIDDLGAERSTDFALEKVYNIIDSRYRSKRPIILTTNLSLEEMKQSVDTRYMRIYDRIFELCYPMKFTGQSWRKTEASRRFEDMRKFMEDDDE